eukprot:jgi/Hompol1/563/HPOL_003764-RA
MERSAFDNIFLGGSVGRFKLSEAGVGWKNSRTGEIVTVSASDIRSLLWMRVARDHQLRLTKRDSSVLMFDGFPKDAFDQLAAHAKQSYGVTLESRETSVRGYNWGQAEFRSKFLSFNVGNKPAFEIPLAQVANAAVGNKNEVSLEFAPPPTDPYDPRGRVREDCLVEVRFFVPGNVTAGQINQDSDGRRKFKDKREDDEEDVDEPDEKLEIGEISTELVLDDDGEAMTAAAMFCETIKQKSDLDAQLSETIVSFSELLCVTPRGRFIVDMHDTFLRLRGKSHDYKIQYAAIKRLFQLPKPDDLHYVFVIGLDPPLRQGQTKYPYLVFQFGREDEIEVDLSISQEAIDTKYQGLQKSYDGPLYEVVSDVFRGLSGKKIISPSPIFRSAHGHSGLKCSLKANEAILYPLEKSFLAIPKPPIFFSFSEITAVTFSRVSSSSSSSTKTFEVKFSLTSGLEYSFSSIASALEQFCNGKKLPVRNELAEAPAVYRDSDDEGGDSGGRRRKSDGQDGDGGDDDMNSESEDEDFVGESESDVDEEFNEDYDSDSEAGSNAASDDDGNASDDRSNRRQSSSKNKRSARDDNDDDDEDGESAPKKSKKASSSNKDEPAKKRAKKDPGAPKRPMSAFLYFAAEQRSIVLAKNPGLSMTDVTKELGVLWKETTDRSKYDELANEDKKRYEREMAAYNKSGGASAAAGTPSSSKAAKAGPSAQGSPPKSSKSAKSADFIASDDEDFE